LTLELLGPLRDSPFQGLVERADRLLGSEPGAQLAVGEPGAHQDQDQAERARQQNSALGASGEAGCLLRSAHQQLPLGIRHLRDHRARRVHQDLATAGREHFVASGRSLPARRQPLIEHGEPPRADPVEPLEQVALGRVVGDELAQAGHLRADLRDRAGVRLEVALLAHQQEAPLAGLGVLERREHRLEPVDHLVCVRDPPGRGGGLMAALLSRPAGPGEQYAGSQKAEIDDRSGPRPGRWGMAFHRRTGRRRGVRGKVVEGVQECSPPAARPRGDRSSTERTCSASVRVSTGFAM
jgi:hypothetical protein